MEVHSDVISDFFTLCDILNLTLQFHEDHLKREIHHVEINYVRETKVS